ncbi:Actin patches distal protein [Trema orientale]|uniref:Actin patches distal protein n=1 Tax=Trema orientale TaxID=63057 RepID=A0A2P5EL90_TREOI|nr:Actin patches distal protein [Trema orientale]
MASSRDRDDPLTFANPSSSSSPITVSSDPLDSYLNDPSSHIGSASGSFQNEGLLADTSGRHCMRLTHFDVDTFVEEVLVKDGEWLPGTPETLKGSYIFVCSHGSRDRRCGLCGPALVNKFRDEIELHGLQGKVSVSPCSHVGGHKYAGNVIIFGPNINGEVTGHWYGYVSPDDVSALLELHIGKGEIVDQLWRGQMGLSEEEQKASQYRRLQMNGDENAAGKVNELVKTQRSLSNSGALRSQVEVVGCCQENGNSSCCQNPMVPEKSHCSDANEKSKKLTVDKKKSSRKLTSRINSGKSTRRVCSMPTWLESWEREDTYAALAVACAALSVAVAYSCYKQLR